MAFWEELTSEQTGLMGQYKRAWQDISLSVDPIDPAVVSGIVAEIYDYLERPVPQIHCFASIYGAMDAATEQFGNPYLDRTCFQAVARLAYEIDQQIVQQIRDGIGRWDGRVSEGLRPDPWIDLDQALAESLDIHYTGQAHYDIQQYTEYGLRQYWFLSLSEYRYDAAFFDFHYSVANPILSQPIEATVWQIFEKLMKSCGWMIPFESVCFVSDQPRKILTDDQGQFHGNGETALEFADGRGLYAHHGIVLPASYGRLPLGEWLPSSIQTEEDKQLQTLLIQITVSTVGKHRTLLL
jgi:hypothetical protein